MFIKGPSLAARIVSITVLSLGLLALDFHFQRLAAVKSVLGTLATPLFWVTDAPAEMLEWTRHSLASRTTLVEENARLRSESLVLKAKMQKMSALAAENGRLRALLHSAALLQSDEITVAEMIGAVSLPGRHEIFIDKGSSDEVFVGQTVLDADGLMGQVTAVNMFTSQVILITDARHALPVQVSRSGMRGIAEGLGRYDRLEMTNVPLTADVRIGDLLESSGLGRRFPPGYPVARVTAINRAPGQAFLTVRAVPLAKLDRSRQLLLVAAVKRG